MTAPVSLAEIKGLNRAACGYIHLRQKERDALVELAEAYLAWQAFATVEMNDANVDGVLADLRTSRERLALAAKGVRP